MGHRITFRQAAEDDLNSIYDFIAEDSPTHAREFTRRLRAQCEALSDFPERGRSRDDLGAGLRTLVFERRVTIAYRVLPDRVQIVRMLYGGRDLERLLRNGN